MLPQVAALQHAGAFKERVKTRVCVRSVAGVEGALWKPEGRPQREEPEQPRDEGDQLFRQREPEHQQTFVNKS